MSPIAFGLRAEYDNDEFLGGVLAVGDSSIDVREALAAGKGRIEVADDDYLLHQVLSDYPPLEVLEDKKSRKKAAAEAAPEPTDNPSQED